VKTHFVFSNFFPPENHAIYATMWEKTQNALFYFHNNSCSINVPRCYIILTLPVLLLANLVQTYLAQLQHFPPQFMLLILLMIFLAYNCTMVESQFLFALVISILFTLIL